MPQKSGKIPRHICYYVTIKSKIVESFERFTPPGAFFNPRERRKDDAIQTEETVCVAWLSKTH